ncbi:MAG: hypothetical protein QNK04_05095 [Myxococcota bacterium]|nr:hypothetical protein [Myxococcota bacterium]
MDRRDFLLGGGAALSLLPLARAAGATGAGGAADATDTQSRQALHELLDLIREIDARYLGPEWRITRPGDVSDGHRFVMHVLQTALFLQLESNPERPVFRRIVSPTRKLLGDNPDAIYYEAELRGGRRYRVRGNTAGATYTSFTIEAGGEQGGYAARGGGAINDTELEIAADGSFTLDLAPDPPEKNGLALPDDARSLTTRHYFESASSVAADPGKQVPLVIEPLDDPAPPATPDDASIAASIRRVASYLRGNTLGMPPQTPESVPTWVSLVPNRFNPPEKPGDMAFAAVDNAYTMAPYALGPDQALVIEGRFPSCRFANVVLWNRFLQTYDYVNRRISLNRAQTRLDAEGRYRLVIAHRDPGVPNWLDTEGRPSGVVYWRFLLPEGEIVTPQARVVPFGSIQG